MSDIATLERELRELDRERQSINGSLRDLTGRRRSTCRLSMFLRHRCTIITSSLLVYCFFVLFNFDEKVSGVVKLRSPVEVAETQLSAGESGK